MPRFTPFAALRYRSDLLAEATAPPYDVLSESEADVFRRQSEVNIVHVDLPAGSLDDRYRDAARRLDRWRDDGVMVDDDAPTLTIYRLRFRDATGAAREIAGVLGGLEVVDEGAGGVLPHERVTPKATSDRLELTRATSANLSPIWGLSLSTGLADLLRDAAEPIGVVEVDGVEHRVERVVDPARIAAISARVAADDVLIADGHHRYGVARTYRDERRAQRHGDAGSAEETLAFVSELTPEHLSVDAIHRLYHDVDLTVLVDALSVRFELESAPPVGPDTLAQMAEQGRLYLLGPSGGFWMRPLPGAFDDVRSIDGAWLEHALDGTAHRVTYQHGVDHVRSAVDRGDATAGVLIRPVGITEIERTAREGALMPPKSTFFTPKLRTGLVVRALD